MRVYKLDSNNFYVTFTELTEENKDTLNYTAKQMTVGYVKPKFDFDLDEWVEGATQQEIDAWHEANRPPIQEVDKITILEQQITTLETENLALKSRLDNLEQTLTGGIQSV